MGLKTDSYPTNSRSQKQNPRDFKIKQIIETTRCTHAEAEEALNENNQELESAVTWVLDHTGDNVWTENKTRKAKKTEVVEVEKEKERPARGENGNRRGGKRGGGATRKTFNRNEQPQKSAAPVANAQPPIKSTSPVVNGSQPSAKVSEATSISSMEKPSSVIKTAAGPLSFAAVCAAGQKKTQPVPSPVVTSAKPSSPVTTPVKPVQSPQPASPSTAKEASPAPADTPVKSFASVSKPTTEFSNSDAVGNKFGADDAQLLTSQLKNDLGLGSTKNSPAATSSMISTPSAAPAVSNSRGTVEFGSDLNTNKSFDYQFGFNPETSATPVEESTFKSSNSNATQNDLRMHESDVYKNTSTESTAPASKPVASAISQLSNSYGVHPQHQQQPASPVQQQSQQQQQPRRTLGYAETSTVSYQPENRTTAGATPAAPPTTTSAATNYTKPVVTAQSSFPHMQQPQVQPLHQQHTTQQQMFNPAAMYNSYPYVNLYSPVAGRAEDSPYAPYHMPYAYGMDLSQMMHTHMPVAPVSGHPQQQPTHRTDHHQNFNENMKQAYGQGAAAANATNVNPSGQRDANMTSANVPPPPGFSGPPTNMMNHFPSMFQYPTMAFMQKMPNQMYGQQNMDEDMRHQAQQKMYGQPDKYSNGSNVRERMNMGTQQPSNPPAQGNYGQNSYGNNGQMNSVKKFGGQWS